MVSFLRIVASFKPTCLNQIYPLHLPLYKPPDLMKLTLLQWLSDSPTSPWKKAHQATEGKAPATKPRGNRQSAAI